MLYGFEALCVRRLRKTTGVTLVHDFDSHSHQQSQVLPPHHQLELLLHHQYEPQSNGKHETRPLPWLALEML